MSDSYELEAVKRFEDLLKKASDGDTSINESDLQEFLERYTAFIPTPFMLNHGVHFNCFISKLRIGPYVSDLAYLTKSSDVWNIVLIELENPHKKLFKGKSNRAEFSADYYNALQQIKEWRAEVERNKEKVIEQLKYIRKPLECNDVFFKYVIIMGRNAEKSEARKRLIANECESFMGNLRIITYDTLLTDYEREWKNRQEYIVISLDERGNAKIKTLPNGRINTPVFAYLSHEHLEIDQEKVNRLEEQDYEMESWINGELLNYNEKCTKDGMAKKLQRRIIL